MLGGGSQIRQPAPQAALLELWSEPHDLPQANLLWGSSQEANAPDKSDVFTVLAVDKTGYSGGYDVKGPDGREWDIKVGKEWAWLENPFAGTRPLQGLVAINLLLNNFDLKTSNNRVYRLLDARAEPKRRYVVQDVGASLGKPRTFPPYFRGTRNDIDDYEDLNLISKINGSKVQLDYRGHRTVLEHLSPADVIWACELMNRLSDAQLDDAFKAADYAPDVRQRYITKLRSKIREGLALRTAQDTRPRESRE